ALRIKPYCLLIGWKSGASLKAGLGGGRAYSQALPKRLSCLGGQLEQVSLVAGEGLLRNGIAADSILHAYVQPDAFVPVAWKGGVGTEDNDIGARIDTQALQGCFGQTIFVGEGQFAFDPGNILARHHTKGAIGRQLRVEHFGKGRRQPVVLRSARQIPETEHSDRAPRADWRHQSSCLSLGRRAPRQRTETIDDSPNQDALPCRNNPIAAVTISYCRG